MEKVLVVGPPATTEVQGGYTRKMHQYQRIFKDIFLDHGAVFFHNSVPSMGWPKAVRFIHDCILFAVTLIGNLRSVSVIHILGQYRGALPRELAQIFLSKFFFKRVVYEIKAGAFISSYESGSQLYKFMIRLLVSSCQYFLCQGKPYIAFIHKLDPSKKTIYFPNFILNDELLPEREKYFEKNKVVVFMAGNLTRDKGVIELLEGIELAGQADVEVVLAGVPDPEVEAYIQSGRFPWLRMVGQILPERIQAFYRDADIYCLPTKYSGEGHNNSINEALNAGCIVVTTHHGFVDSFLNDESCFFLDRPDRQEIARVISEIMLQPEIAVRKAREGNRYLRACLTSSEAVEKLRMAYTKPLLSA